MCKGPLMNLQCARSISASYLNTIRQSHVSPYGCYASWQTTQAAVFSIFTCCVTAQCNRADAAKSTCTTEVYFNVNFFKENKT